MHMRGFKLLGYPKKDNFPDIFWTFCKKNKQKFGFQNHIYFHFFFLKFFLNDAKMDKVFSFFLEEDILKIHSHHIQHSISNAFFFLFFFSIKKSIFSQISWRFFPNITKKFTKNTFVQSSAENFNPKNRLNSTSLD